MSLRALLVVLIVAATAAFVVGVSIERGHEAAHHDVAGETAAPSDERQEAGGEAEEHAEGEHAEGEHAEAEPRARGSGRAAVAPRRRHP
jgi:hypothetical protein